jgi:hypothetical protein
VLKPGIGRSVPAAAKGCPAGQTQPARSYRCQLASFATLPSWHAPVARGAVRAVHRRRQTQ